MQIHFDTIGFWLPALISLIWLPGAFREFKWRGWAYFAIAMVITWMNPIRHENGVGLLPVYWIVLVMMVVRRKKRDGWDVERWRIAHAMSVGFWTVAIPDIGFCMLYGDGSWIVGAAGWNDGLVRWWLFAYPVVTVTWFALNLGHWADRKAELGFWGEKRKFPWRRWLKFHFSIFGK